MWIKHLQVCQVTRTERVNIFLKSFTMVLVELQILFKHQLVELIMWSKKFLSTWSNEYLSMSLINFQATRLLPKDICLIFLKEINFPGD